MIEPTESKSSETEMTKPINSTRSELLQLAEASASDTKLFGAPGPYILTKDWTGSNTDNTITITGTTTREKSTIESITIMKAPMYINTDGIPGREIAGSNGLFMYFLNYNKDIVIYAPEDKQILVDADASYLFSSTVDTAKFNALDLIDGLDLLDTSNVTNMSHMFDGARGLTELNLKNFNTSQAQQMDSMFLNCEHL